MIRIIVLLSVVSLSLSIGTASPFVFKTWWNANQLMEKVNSGELQEGLTKFVEERQESAQKALADSQERIAEQQKEAQRFAAQQQESAQKAAEERQNSAQTFAEKRQESAQKAAGERQKSAQEFAEQRQESAQKSVEDRQNSAQTFAEDQQKKAQDQATQMKDELKAEVDQAKTDLKNAKEELKAAKDEAAAELKQIKEEIDAERAELQEQLKEEKTALEEQLAAERQALKDEWKGTKEGLAEAQENLNEEFAQSREDLERGFAEREQALKDEYSSERERINQTFEDAQEEVERREEALAARAQGLEDAGADKIKEVEDKASELEQSLAAQQAAFQAQMKADREAFLEEMRLMREQAKNEYSSAKEKATSLEAEMREYAAKTDEDIREEGRSLRADYEQARDSAENYAQTQAQRRLAEKLADGIVVYPSSREMVFYLQQVEQGLLHTVMLQDPKNATIKLMLETDATNLMRAKQSLKDMLQELKQDQLYDIKEDVEAYKSYKDGLAKVVQPVAFDNRLSGELSQLMAEFDAGLYGAELNAREKEKLQGAKDKFRLSLQNIVRSRVIFLGDDLEEFTKMYNDLAGQAVDSARQTTDNAVLLGKLEALRLETQALRIKIKLLEGGISFLKQTDSDIRSYKIKAAKVSDDLKAAGLTEKAGDVPMLVDQVAESYLESYIKAIEFEAGKTQVKVLYTGSVDDIAGIVRTFEQNVEAFKKKVNSVEVKGKVGQELVSEALADIKEFTVMVRAAEKARRDGGLALSQARDQASALRETTPELFEGVSSAALDAVSLVAKTPGQLMVMSKYEGLKQYGKELERSLTPQTESDRPISNINHGLAPTENSIASYRARANAMHKELIAAADIAGHQSIKDEFIAAANEVPTLLPPIMRGYFTSYMYALGDEAGRVGEKIETAELDDLAAIERGFESKANRFIEELLKARSDKEVDQELTDEYREEKQQLVADIKEEVRKKRSSQIDEQERNLNPSSR